MSKHRFSMVLFGCALAATILLTTPNTRATDYSPNVYSGISTSTGWFSFLRNRSNKSNYSTSTKKDPPSMSNGSFYEKWRADRKASGRAHRP